MIRIMLQESNNYLFILFFVSLFIFISAYGVPPMRQLDLSWLVNIPPKTAGTLEKEHSKQEPLSGPLEGEAERSGEEMG